MTPAKSRHEIGRRPEAAADPPINLRAAAAFRQTSGMKSADAREAARRPEARPDATSRAMKAARRSLLSAGPHAPAAAPAQLALQAACLRVAPAGRSSRGERAREVTERQSIRRSWRGGQLAGGFFGRPGRGSGSVRRAQCSMSRRRQTRIRPPAIVSTGAGKSFRCAYRWAVRSVTPSRSAISWMLASSATTGSVASWADEILSREA